MSQLLIRGGRCVNPTGEFQADVLVDDGRIVALGHDLGRAAGRVIDARGLLVLPGGVDVHVHLPWPTGSAISSDDFATGTQAAAFGGTTTVLDFVIPSDGESLVVALDRKVAEAGGCAWVDYGLHINVRGDIAAALPAIAGLVRQGFPSFKVFMAYEGFRVADGDLLRVMQAVTAAGGMISAHAEDGLLADLATHDLAAAGLTSLAHYPAARPPLCEISAIQRILSYARHFGTRTHIHHVSTAEGAALIGAARREGLPVTGETCPQYLLLDEQVYGGEPDSAVSCVCAPPIRTCRDQDTLWAALATGSLSMVATDHCPYTARQKAAGLSDFTQAPGGMAGVETRLPLLFSSGVVKGRLALSLFVEVWATAPAAAAFGLYPQKGIIAVGSDADLVLVDPAQRSRLSAGQLHSRTDCLPYEGWEVQGRPVTTILRGAAIIEDGRLAADAPAGRLVRRRFAEPTTV